jgi:hypothetical protein
LAEKKDVMHTKLVTPKRTKNDEELAYEEYARQLELAIENH